MAYFQRIAVCGGFEKYCSCIQTQDLVVWKTSFGRKCVEFYYLFNDFFILIIRPKTNGVSIWQNPQKNSLLGTLRQNKTFLEQGMKN